MISGGGGGGIGGIEGGGEVTAMAVGEESGGGPLEGGSADCTGPWEMREERLRDLSRFVERVTEGCCWWAVAGEEEKKMSCW